MPSIVRKERPEPAKPPPPEQGPFIIWGRPRGGPFVDDFPALWARFGDVRTFRVPEGGLARGEDEPEDQ